MIGKNIRKYRDERGLTLCDLAEISKISKSTISALETGAFKNPTIKTLKKISRALYVPVCYLIEEVCKCDLEVRL